VRFPLGVLSTSWWWPARKQEVLPVSSSWDDQPANRMLISVVSQIATHAHTHHEKVPIAVLLNLLHRLIRVVRNVLVQQRLGKQNLLGLNLNVGRLSLRPTERLVDHDAGVGQRFALAGRARPQQKGPHAGGHAEAHRLHVAGNELHGVKNGQSRRHAAARRVDVQGNVLVGVLVGEVQESVVLFVVVVVVVVASFREEAVMCK